MNRWLVTQHLKKAQHTSCDCGMGRLSLKLYSIGIHTLHGDALAKKARKYQTLMAVVPCISAGPDTPEKTTCP
jgi:hypothetical protein